MITRSLVAFNDHARIGSATSDGIPRASLSCSADTGGLQQSAAAPNTASIPTRNTPVPLIGVTPKAGYRREFSDAMGAAESSKIVADAVLATGKVCVSDAPPIFGRAGAVHGGGHRDGRAQPG